MKKVINAVKNAYSELRRTSGIKTQFVADGEHMMQNSAGDTGPRRAHTYRGARREMYKAARKQARKITGSKSRAFWPGAREALEKIGSTVYVSSRTARSVKSYLKYNPGRENNQTPKPTATKRTRTKKATGRGK